MIYALPLKRKGFSLIEVMAAVAVISFSMLGIFSLTVYGQKIYLNTKNQFTAAMLSQEGAELVRNVRDSNWLDGLAFNDGIDAAVFRIDTQAGIKGSITAVDDINDADALLKQLGGVYRHDSGDATAFSRVIQTEVIDEPNGAAIDGLKVTSLVQWREGATTRQRQTVVFLYDWRQ